MICVGDKEVERVERARRSDSCGLFIDFSKMEMS